MKILYIDDELINRHHFDLFFSALYEVYLAENREEVLDILKDNTIDIIFSDQKLLAEYTGTDLLTEIHGEYTSIPKYIITGYLESEEIEEAMSGGIILSVIHKPFLFSDIKELIESHIY